MREHENIKRVQCPRHGQCEQCLAHHHLPAKKLPTACQRLHARKNTKKA